MSRREFDHALIVGKFFPPHVGHEYLVRTALQFSRRVTVLVLAASSEPLPMELRARWLRQCFPDTLAGKTELRPKVRSAEGRSDHSDLRVVAALDDVPVDYDDEAIWRAHVDVMRRALRGDAAAHNETERPVDVVFSSEEYGETLARWFGARHVCLDRARALYPISGTDVRRDLTGCWMALPAPVRAGLALRVALVGAESTGTTTLARDLCDALRARGGAWTRTEWVPEYGREFSVNLLAAARAHDPAARPEDAVWTEEDFVDIACEQNRRENEAARQGGPVLVCDTDAMATAIWHERYLGTRSASVERVADAMAPRALYLLTDHADVPFEDDGLRDGEHLRAWMNGRFVDVLSACPTPWHLVSGPPDHRLRSALRHIDDAMSGWWPFIEREY
jgi:HTH-type transcriptional regulator, transcriptional repressor of NAD biosynthesis genes